MATKLSLLLATLSALGATVASTAGNGRDVVDDVYTRLNSSRGLDVVFVLDRSGTVTRKLWISMINFVKVKIDKKTA